MIDFKSALIIFAFICGLSLLSIFVWSDITMVIFYFIYFFRLIIVNGKTEDKYFLQIILE